MSKEWIIMGKLADLFYNAAKSNPNKIAIWCDNEKITYKELRNLVSQYSNFLITNGVNRGDHIGVPMNNSITSVALILTAANIGVALVPFNPTLPINSVKTMINSANIKHIIARKSFFDSFSKEELEIKGLKICIDDEIVGGLNLNNATKFSKERIIVENVSENDRFIITMTSGSTGNPKPIVLTQKNKFDRSIAHIDLYKITKEDRVLAATPLYHSLAERLVLMPLIIGATSIILPRFTPRLWLRCVSEQEVTFTIAVSAQLNQVVDELENFQNVNTIKSLRCLVSSSALLEQKVKEKLINLLNCDFHEMYGTSETSTVTSINFKDTIHKKNSVGRPLKDTSILILDENDEKLDFYEIGEISCKTPLICGGYYGMNSKFQEAFFKDYFKTGDLGYIDEDGYLYFVDRKKDLIITGGVNVYPKDIERCVMSLDEVSECAAFPLPNKKLGEIVALAVVIKKGCELDKRKIQLHCAKFLADFQQPQKIFFVEELPKNSMGKLVKSKLINQFKEILY